MKKMKDNMIFKAICGNKRRLASVSSIAIIFVMASSFTFAGGDGESGTFDRIYVETGKGVIGLEEMEDGDFSISMNDIEDTVKNSAAEFSQSDASFVSDGDTDENTLVVDELGNQKKASFRDDWSLILINRQHPIPDDYEFELETIKGSIKSDRRVVSYVLDMIRAAQDDGVTLYICSPYRDYQKQEKLFENKMKFYTRQGFSESEAYDLASQTVAVPGTSEHQIGLAFDFISDDYSQLDEGFAETDAGKWLKENAADYGFILRYPKDKEEITGIEFEPWHYRFVGTNASREIMDSGLCLEEYDELIGIVE